MALLTGSHQLPLEGGTFRTTGPSGNLQEFQDSVCHGGVFIQMSSLTMSRVVPLLQSQSHGDVLAKMRRGVQFDSLDNPNNKKILKGPVAASRPVPHMRSYTRRSNRALFSHSMGVPVWKGRSFNQFDPHGDEPAGYSVWSDVLSFAHNKRNKSPHFQKDVPCRSPCGS